MSLTESKESSCTVSLKELFENNEAEIFDENKDSSLERTAFLLCRGGWPLSVRAGDEISLDVTRNYYKGLFKPNLSPN